MKNGPLFNTSLPLPGLFRAFRSNAPPATSQFFSHPPSPFAALTHFSEPLQYFPRSTKYWRLLEICPTFLIFLVTTASSPRLSAYAPHLPFLNAGPPSRRSWLFRFLHHHLPARLADPFSLLVEAPFLLDHRFSAFLADHGSACFQRVLSFFTLPPVSVKCTISTEKSNPMKPHKSDFRGGSNL